mgnify:CR=1 FL=1
MDVALDTINAAGMDKSYGTYGDDECFDIQDYDDDLDHDHDTDDDRDDDTDDDTNVDTDDDTDGGGRGNRRPLPGGAVGGVATHPRPTWTETGAETETTETETQPSAPGTPQTNAPRDDICRSGHRQALTPLTLIFDIN